MNLRILLLLFTFLPTLASAQLIGDTENGLASYYSAEYDGAETAYNVIYDKNQLVAAHRQYPFNSTVRVKNMENGKSVVVRIIDEGPFIRSRVIELSERAAGVIDLLGKETVPVELTLLSVPGQQGAVSPVVETAPIINDPVVTPANDPVVVEAQPRITRPVAEPVERTPEPKATTPTPQPERTAPARKTATATRPAPTVPSSRNTSTASSSVKVMPVNSKKLLRKPSFSSGTYKIILAEVPNGKHGVQVASFNNLEHAMDKVTELQSKWFDNILLEKVMNGAYATYKVILGPFTTEKSALRYASDLKKRYKIDGFTVELKK